jgi:thioredoxin reductase
LVRNQGGEEEKKMKTGGVFLHLSHKMADDLGDEWWLSNDENNDIDTQSTSKTQEIKSSICFCSA